MSDEKKGRWSRIKIPVYINRRLVQYYWDRLKKNKLSLVGLGFIVFLALIGIFGPFFTMDPQHADFNIKNLPPLGFSMQESVYDIKTNTFTTTVIRAGRTIRWARTARDVICWPC